MPQKTRFYLYKRSNGFFYIGYSEGGRLRWRSTRTQRKPEALQALSEFRELFRARTEEVTLRRFTKQFLQYARVNYSASTVDLYDRTLRLLAEFVRDCTLSHLTPQHLDGYKVKRLKDGLARRLK